MTKLYFNIFNSVIIFLIISMFIFLAANYPNYIRSERCKKMCDIGEVVGCVELKENKPSIPATTMVAMCVENNKLSLLTEKK